MLAALSKLDDQWRRCKQLLTNPDVVLSMVALPVLLELIWVVLVMYMELVPMLFELVWKVLVM
eukprot:2105803-Prorocentrum_lima.AAC.1